MKKLSLIYFFFSSLFSSAQNPSVKIWDYRFGGTQSDILTYFQETQDSGFILAGYSKSGIGGDKSQTCVGGTTYGDYWIIKLNSYGLKEWDKDFGGPNDEVLISLQETKDGGYLLGGYSNSGVGGDKTELNWNQTGNSPDYWIVKIDSLGNKQWDKDFGGTDEDYLYSLQQTADSGYILGGVSYSGIGGNKTKASYGGRDYWVIKIDQLGTKQWEKEFGGTNDDDLISLAETNDGGFIFSGPSYSGIGGSKTTPIWGGQSSDYWIIKTDSLGNKEWEKDFGGSDWDEGAGTIFKTSDKGYLFSGTSYSTISGDKTESNLGQEQIWVLKTDSNGYKEWDKTLFTNDHDERGYGIQTKDGCYVFANYTKATIAGDKTQSPWNNSYDYWIIKFCDSTLLPIASATASSPLCPGTCTSFLNTSTQSTSYQWSFFGAIPSSSSDVNPQSICYSAPGSYNVQLIATNINGSDTLLLNNYITVYPTPPPQGITQSGDTLFANAGANAYQWYFSGNIISGATNYFLAITDSGDYNVICTDTNGCEVEAAIFDVHIGINELSLESKISVYPNPAGNQFTIHNAQLTIGTAVAISIYNLLGEKVYSIVDHRLRTIDCRLLPSGIYFLEVTVNEKTYRAKFAKR